MVRPVATALVVVDVVVVVLLVVPPLLLVVVELPPLLGVVAVVVEDVSAVTAVASVPPPHAVSHAVISKDKTSLLFTLASWAELIEYPSPNPGRAGPQHDNGDRSGPARTCNSL